MKEKPINEALEKGTDKSRTTDDFLEWLVRHTERGGLSFPITLYVSGLLICGMTISSREYFSEFAKGIEAGLKNIPLDDETKKSFVAGFSEMGNKDKDAIPESLNHIHLKDTKIFSPSTEKTFSIKKGFLWRGRLESVDGFTLGVISKTWLSKVIGTFSSH